MTLLCCLHVRLIGTNPEENTGDESASLVVTDWKMKDSQTHRALKASVDVLEPGKGKALLHVLADGRASGHYKLSRRELEQV